MDVKLTPESVRMVEEHLACGRFSSAAGVVEAALRVLEEREEKEEKEGSDVPRDALLAAVARGEQAKREGRSREVDGRYWESLRARVRAVARPGDHPGS